MAAVMRDSFSNVVVSAKRAEEPLKLISVVIPVLDEQENIVRAYQAVREVFAHLAPSYDFEIIFIDSHSSDFSFQLIEQLTMDDPRIRGVRLTRNFGFHRSVLTGLRLARGQAAIPLDCDLQDPVSVIADFLDQWANGHDLVAGVRRSRADGQPHQWARRLFYRLLSRISQDSVHIDSGDFRLVDRRILDHLCRMQDASPYIRGLISSLATNPAVVYYDRDIRRAGRSKFGLPRLIAMAADALCAHSIVPLRLATYTGLIVAILALILSAGYILGRLLGTTPWPAGFATTTALILFGISLNAIFLGIIGEYVGRIYNQ